MDRYRSRRKNRKPIRKPQTKLPRKHPLIILRNFFLGTVYLGILISIGATGFLFYLSRNLPSLNELVKPKYDLPTRVYDQNNNLITEFYTERRVLVPFEKVPDIMVKALLAIEDNRFYRHFGIDPMRIVKAIIIDVKVGGFDQGASTLTQQVAKNFFLSSEKTIIRKLKEQLLALKMETMFSKNKILELYLNKAYFGHGTHGIEAAAQGYFSKHVEELNLVEATLLAGLPKAPSALNPIRSIERATKRRNQVLRMMAKLGYISSQESIRAMASPVELKLNQSIAYNETSYYMEHIRRYIFEKYGVDQLYRGGLSVYTAMDLNQQIFAQNALYQGLVEHDKRQGYRGAQKNIFKELDQELGLFIYSDEKGWDWDEFNTMDDDMQWMARSLRDEKIKTTTAQNQLIIGGKVLGVVTQVKKDLAEVDLGKYQGNILLDSMRWARSVDYEETLNWKTELKDLNDVLRIGDVIELEILDYDHENQEFTLVMTQEPIANGGIFVMDPRNGHVMAMAGGYDFRESEFNRAIQSYRQPGSTFKPIVYSLALDSSFTWASMLDDSPLTFKDTEWKPRNYSGRFKGKVSLRSALVHSANIPTLRLTEELRPEAIINHARKLGISSELPNDLTLGIGSASVTLLEMVRAYGVFANGGNLVKPVFIIKIEDREGNILEENDEVDSIPVLSEETSYLMTVVLKDVVQSGSGWRAKAINRPSAGKTGTTNNYTDAWYIGFIPQLITGIYVGFDKNQKTLGDTETGSRTAAPIWVHFMKQATANLPILPFKQPDGINTVRINVDSGLLACDTSKKSIYEYFKAGTEPTICHKNYTDRGAVSNRTVDDDQIVEENLGEDSVVEEL